MKLHPSRPSHDASKNRDSQSQGSGHESLDGQTARRNPGIHAVRIAATSHAAGTTGAHGSTGPDARATGSTAKRTAAGGEPGTTAGGESGSSGRRRQSVAGTDQSKSFARQSGRNEPAAGAGEGNSSGGAATGSKRTTAHGNCRGPSRKTQWQCGLAAGGCGNCASEATSSSIVFDKDGRHCGCGSSDRNCGFAVEGDVTETSRRSLIHKNIANFRRYRGSH